MANGNPGLQDILTRPLMAGEFEAVADAIAAIEDFLARGEVPAEANAAFEFFRRMTFERYRAALAPGRDRDAARGQRLRRGRLARRTWTPRR